MANIDGYRNREKPDVGFGLWGQPVHIRDIKGLETVVSSAYRTMKITGPDDSSNGRLLSNPEGSRANRL